MSSLLSCQRNCRSSFHVKWRDTWAKGDHVYSDLFQCSISEKNNQRKLCCIKCCHVCSNSISCRDLCVGIFIAIKKHVAFGLKRFKFKLILGLEDTEVVCIHSFIQKNKLIRLPEKMLNFSERVFSFFLFLNKVFFEFPRQLNLIYFLGQRI